jgi:hypothetical protein
MLNNNELIATLKKYGFNSVNEKKSYENIEITPLEAALIDQDFESVKLFLNHGANTNLAYHNYENHRYIFSNVYVCHDDGINMLMNIIKGGPSGCIEFIDKNYADHPLAQDFIQKTKDFSLPAIRVQLAFTVTGDKFVNEEQNYRIKVAAENIRIIEPDADLIAMVLQANQGNILESFEAIKLCKLDQNDLNDAAIDKILEALHEVVKDGIPKGYNSLKSYLHKVKGELETIFDNDLKDSLNTKFYKVSSDILVKNDTLANIAFRNILKQIDEKGVLDIEKLGKSIFDNAKDENDRSYKLEKACEVLSYKIFDSGVLLNDIEQNIVNDLLGKNLEA